MRLVYREMGKWYVVYKGRVPGVYEKWEDCKKQVNEFKDNNHKSYKTKAEAEARYANHLLEEEKTNRMMTSNIIVNNHNIYDSKAETEARYLHHLPAEERKNRMKSNFIVIPFLLIVIVILLYVIVV